MMNKYAPLFMTEYTFAVGIKMDQIVAALHNSSIRSKWDSHIVSIKSIKKVDRIELLHILNAPHKLINTKRDMFEKKFGFSHRPII